MDLDIAKTLKESRIFSSLDEKAIQQLVPKFSETLLEQGEALFYQGDPSNHVYLLVSGKMSAELTTSNGESRIIGHIDPGESVGELGALANEPRTLTVRALKACTLLKLDSSEFISICNLHPAIMFETIHPMIERSKNLIQFIAIEKTTKHIIIVPANRDISLEEFSNKLLQHIERFQSLLVVSDFQTNLYDKTTDINTLKEKIATLTQHKKGSVKILYLLKSPDSLLAKIAFKKAHRIYIAANSLGEPRIDNIVLDKIHSVQSHLNADPDLIMLHAPETKAPKNTIDWLRLMDFRICHHVRIDVTSDYRRLLRFIREKALGLVLSGGGTRGWAHLGVIKALQEEKIPIDIIGGTSVGALVGASFAMQGNFANAYENFSHIVNESRFTVSWRSLTWPIISLFNAKRFTQSQIDVFQETCIEDLWLPFYCVSCNLTTNAEDIHRSGLLWERTRASSSIPGIVPPMSINGDLHLDGGLLNNLPVDIMRHFIGEKGRIIAVELNTFSPIRSKFNFPPTVSFKEVFFSKLGIHKSEYKYPRFIDTFLHGLFVGSLAKAKQNSLGANYYLSLNLSKFGMLHSNAKQAARMIELGYQAALSRIQELRKKS